MRLTAIALTLLVALITAPACKPRGDSGLQAYKAGQKVNPGPNIVDDPDVKKRTPVLIYYANDTFAPKTTDKANVNFLDLIAKLRRAGQSTTLKDTDKAILVRLADSLESDYNNFRDVVAQEQSSLTTYICTPNPRYPIGLAIFRNSGAVQNGASWANSRELIWSYCMPNQLSTTNRSVTIPIFNDFRYDSQPLSHAFVLETLLRDVREVFPQDKFQYVLVTKSHGSIEMAITPDVVADVTQIPEQTLWTTILQGLAKGKSTVNTLDKIPGLPILDSINDALTATPSSPNSDAGSIGIGKRTYLELLNQLGGGDPKKGMVFNTVVMEACRSGLEYSEDEVLKSGLQSYQGSYEGLYLGNIGWLFTSDQAGLTYHSIPYDTLFRGLQFSRYKVFTDGFKAMMDSLANKKS